MVGFLMILLAAMVGGIVYVLLRFSSEEEQRALDEWERAVAAHRRVTDRQRGRIWAEDDDGGDDDAA